MTMVLGVGLFLGACSEDKKGPEVIPSTVNMYGKEYNLQSGVIWKNNRNVMITKEDFTYPYTYIDDDGQALQKEVKGFAAGKDVTITGNLMLSLYGEGLTFNPGLEKVEGKGACICFHLNSTDIDKVVPGKYVYGKEKKPNTFIAYSSVSWDPLNQGTPLEITGGEVNIEQKDNTYTVKFDCKTANGNAIKGQYEGVLQTQKVKQADYGIYEDQTIAALFDTAVVNMTLDMGIPGIPPISEDEETLDFAGTGFYSTITNITVKAGDSLALTDPRRLNVDIALLWDRKTESFMFESPIRTIDWLWGDPAFTFPCHTTYMKAPDTFTDDDFDKLQETGFSFDSKDEKTIIQTKDFKPGYVFFQTGNGVQGVIHFKKFTPPDKDVVEVPESGMVITQPVHATLTMDIKCPVNFINPPIR